MENKMYSLNCDRCDSSFESKEYATLCTDCDKQHLSYKEVKFCNEYVAVKRGLTSSYR